GQDKFQPVRVSYLRGTEGYLLVTDGTRRETLHEALAFDDKVSGVLGRVPSVIVINKSDLVGDWEVEPEEVRALVGCARIVVRTSAKTGEGVESAFHKLACAMLEG